MKSNNKYIKLTKEDIPDFLEIKGNKAFLTHSKAKPFYLELPLILDEEIAKIPAMIMDGSLAKNYSECIFCQKKDKSKMQEIHELIKRKFKLRGRFYTGKNTGSLRVTIGCKTFAVFLSLCLDIHKSDESARIPEWIWQSPKIVISEYLRYAYAMEGSVSQPCKSGLINFHSCDKSYIDELKKLLKLKFNINSKIQEYYIENYGWKYYLFIGKNTEIRKFYKQIGFALDSHQKRLKKIVENIKSKAWEITLVKLLEINQKYFWRKDVKELFPYLHLRTIHARLSTLKDMKYLELSSKGYKITKEGIKKANSLKNKVKITSLRSRPEENESKIFNTIKTKGQSYNSEISRETNLNPTTIRDTLKRLLKQKKIRFTHQDKFQRKYYEIN